MDNKISYYKIEAYLSNAMNEEERKAFEAEIAQNPTLAAIVEKERTVVAPVAYQTLFKGNENSSLLRKFLDIMLIPRYQMALSLSLVLVAVLVFYSPKDLQKQEVVFRAKGATSVVCMKNGADVTAGSFVDAAAGDTVSFKYRSQDSLYIQVWFRDDNKSVLPYISKNGQSVGFSPSNGYTAISSAIVLDNSWQKEDIYLFYSKAPFIISFGENGLELPENSEISVEIFRFINSVKE
jgi:hypothetical protein